MVKKTLLVLAVIILGFLLYVAQQPSGYRVVRTATLVAPAPQVYGLINDFHQWDAWSPWAKLDPSMKTTFEGPSSGPGSVYFWSGDSKVGEGRMTILESVPNEVVRIKLEFLKPFASTNTAVFSLKQDAAANTAVEWVMTGEQNFLMRTIGTFMGGMDKMIGPDFEKGLAQMKAAAESRR